MIEEENKFSRDEFTEKVKNLDPKVALGLLKQVSEKKEALNIMQNTLRLQENVLNNMLEVTLCPIKIGEILKSESGRHYLVTKVYTYDNISDENLSWHLYVSMCKKDGTRTGTSIKQIRCNTDGSNIRDSGYGARKGYRRLAEI
ncbi:MAG: hypothetical protein KAS32_07110 [Candidatus Peribacteraceae bacterium]|nr:hypothetical protein [Candidatus Peribacteraceae bacterium]